MRKENELMSQSGGTRCRSYLKNDFKVAIMKLLQESVTNSFELIEKVENPKKQHKSYKREII